MPGGEDGIGDGFSPVTGHDVSDGNSRYVSRRLDSFIGEIRTQLQDYGTRLDTKLDAFTVALAGIKDEVSATKKQLDTVDERQSQDRGLLHTTVSRVDVHEKQIKAIKARLPRPKKKRKAKR